MKIVAAADHGGFEMKNQIVEDLRKQGFAVEDLGTNSADSVDYPDFAEKATAKVLAGQADLGILVCGTGIGMAMTANKFPGIFAAVCHDIYSAERARLSNDANLLCMGARVIGPELAKMIAREWLSLTFQDGSSTPKVAAMHEIDRVNRR